MKIEQGFIAVTPDGQYLQWWQVSTHCGYRTEFGAVTDIDQASFSRVPRLGYGARTAPEHAVTRGHAWVPATRRVEVILDGYGVAK